MTARSGPRMLVATAAGLAASAVLLWAGSATAWYRLVSADRPPVELRGAQVAPWLGGVALLALAGFAGVVASGGLLRRGIGALLAVVGAAVGGYGVRAMVTDPYAGDTPASMLPTPPPGVSTDELRDLPAEVTAAPLLAVTGAIVLLGAGLFVLVREQRLPRLGSRYAAPGQRVQRDPDRAAWQELDDGRDPTVGPSRGTGDDPDDGLPNTAV